MANLQHDDAIEWPNGEGFTPCTREYAAWLHRGEDMLYPQYAEKFTTITGETWKWLQEQANKNLAEKNELSSPAVRLHWKAIASGKVPFGFQVRGERQ